MVSANGPSVDPSPSEPQGNPATPEPQPKLSAKEQRMRRRIAARNEAVRNRQNLDGTMVEFQSDAVEIETRSVAGGARWTLYTVILLMMATVAWACLSEVDRIVTASGKLITVETPVVIDTSVTAAIRTINVEFGDRVKSGQLLATLDPTYSEADLTQLSAKVNGLEALIARLRSENKQLVFNVGEHQNDPDWMMQYQVFLQRKNEFDAKIREYNAQESRLVVQQESNKLAQELDFAAWTDYAEYQKTIEALAKRGSKSEEDKLSRRLQTGQAKKTYRATQSRGNELVKEVEAIVTQREAYIATRKAETMTSLVEAVQEKTATDQERNKAIRTNEQVELRVPTDRDNEEFFVFEVADVSVGSVARPGDPLFRLVPLDVPYEAEVEISGRDIAMIREGSTKQADDDLLPKGSSVRVKLDSFPFQKHGTIDGLVRKISEGSFEKKGPGGQATGETTYKARIQLLNPDELDNVSSNFRLMPGMTATAEIKVGKRRVIQYFLYPLIRYLDEWGREP